MPLYEYVCTNGHRTEVMHGVYAAGPEACPVCGAAMRKAFVAPTFHFKGSGWAKMDRRSASASRKSAADTTTSDSPASGESGSSTTKAEPAAAPASAGEAPASKTASSATD